MKRALSVAIGYAALAAAIAAPLAYVAGRLELDACKAVMLVATGAWFAASAVELARPTASPRRAGQGTAS